MYLEATVLIGVLGAAAIAYMVTNLVRAIKICKKVNSLQVTNKYTIHREHQPITCYLSISDKQSSLLTYSNLLDWIIFKLPMVEPSSIAVILHKKISFNNQPIVKFHMIETMENIDRLEALGFEPIEEEYLPWNESKRETYLNKQ